MGGRGSAPRLENHKWLYVSLEILVRTPLEKQLDPSGPIFASLGRSIRHPMKNVDDQKKDPLTELSGIRRAPRSICSISSMVNHCIYIYF